MKEDIIAKLNFNAVEYFNNHWALVSARKKDGTFNMCTVSWGSLGELWSKNVCTVYIKPIRYTDSFVDEDEYFTVTFFNEEYKKILARLGTLSGKNIDKMHDNGLTVIKLDKGIDYKEACITLICKKLYKGQFKEENFIDGKEIINHYYEVEEMHNMYIGEIIDVIIK